LSFVCLSFPHKGVGFVFFGLRGFKILKGEVPALRMRYAFENFSPAFDAEGRWK